MGDIRGSGACSRACCVCHSHRRRSRRRPVRQAAHAARNSNVVAPRLRSAPSLQPKRHNTRQPLSPSHGRASTHTRTQLALNTTVRLPRRHLARTATRHVTVGRGPATHAHSPAVAPASKAKACNRHRRRSRRRPVRRAAHRAHNSSIIAPRLRAAALLQPNRHNNRQPLSPSHGRASTHTRTQLALNTTARLPRRHLARTATSHVSVVRSPAAHAHSPAVAPASEAQASNRQGHGSRRRPVRQASNRADSSSIVAPSLRAAALLQPKRNNNRHSLS